MAIFRQTLQRFIATLKERKVDSQLGIAIKDDPSEFTVSYMLGIISKIDKIRESASNSKARICNNFIRKCFRKMEASKGVIEGILTLAPDDIYGSIISGGFTLILAVSSC